MNSKRIFSLLAAVPAAIGFSLLSGFAAQHSESNVARVTPNLVHGEMDGEVSVEAEHFSSQTAADIRAWHIITAENDPGIEPDGDPTHVAGASGGAYLEILPDSRRDHSEALIHGENFSNEPGRLGILSYKIHFENAGRYYVWVRAHSTGGEDNGIHVGLNGEWPETGQRMQWCEGKQAWRWESKQRTEEVHCGEPYKIYLDIPRSGEHVVMFSMREDGFEFDKFILTQNREFVRPLDAGPAPRVKSGKVPQLFSQLADSDKKAEKKPFPARWGAPPKIQTMDYRPLPGGYGFGSSTMVGWIQWNLDMDEANQAGLILKATDFPSEGTGYYLDQDKWLAINPEARKEAKAQSASPFPGGRYDVTLLAVGENDGQSSYELKINGVSVGEFKAPLSQEMFEEGSRFSKTWENVAVNSGDVIEVSSQIGSADGAEFSRARWGKLAFKPADDATRLAVADFKKPTQGSSRSPDEAKDAGVALVQPRQADGDGSVVISGELKQWHKITLTLDGPFAHELDNAPNPFTDHHFTVNFRHESGHPNYTVPGYFATDGDSANSSAEAGTKWKAHLSPDKAGKWTYTTSFISGKNAALQPAERTTVLKYSGTKGAFEIKATDKKGPDFRSKGRLQYEGGRYLQFAGTGEYFLKAGPDAPETMLAYEDFDGTEPGRKREARTGEAAPTQSLKTWSPHVKDWNEGDSTWNGGKGKGLIGALNYLAAKGVNSFSFLPYNSGGDGDNVWPFVARMDKMHYDVSKLAQWGIVFEHGNNKGLHLHFKLQENEIDDDRRGQAKNGSSVPESLDGGVLGLERKLYCRELIARFGHNLALNWNIGEENTQSTEEITDMVEYIHDLDPYHHNIVIHTFPNQQDSVYSPLLGNNSLLTGASLQNEWDVVHQRTLKWINESAAAGRPWVVANDEQGPANQGVPPDPGYAGFDGWAKAKNHRYDMNDVRKYTLWGNLMAGGAGVEYYFGYQLPENDLVAEDFRSRDRSWDFCRIAIEFFHENEIPFWEMMNANSLVGNNANSNAKYCFAKTDELYLVYLPNGGSTVLDLTETRKSYSVQWFNPRVGGRLQNGSVRKVKGGSAVDLGNPPSDANEDWLIVIR